MKWNEFPLRQVHLDFHTSPFIPDVGSEFDAKEFAKTMQRAHVNSVTVFAKCHHGMCYYPTKTGTQHPALGGRDLMGEQIEALHRAGIRAPIYTTVVWEEDVAQKHPEWRQLTRNGFFAGSRQAPGGSPGPWKYNSFVHPEYQDYIEEHVREICANYEVDGLFFDILFHAPNSDWSDPARKLRSKHGLESEEPETHQRFEALAQSLFTARFTKLIKGIAPKATIFYNTHNDIPSHSDTGPRTREKNMTHLEIESLPSGFWGYHHFPRIARGMRHWGKPWLGMTGRFQKSWGDFGGVKPAAALEFECFRSQAMGGGNSVGDQLPPRGKPDAAAYKLIGKVFSQCEAAEPFYVGAKPLPQVGIVSAAFAGLPTHETGQSMEGAVMFFEEAHYDCSVLDEESDCDGFDLLVLPDSSILTASLRKKIAQHCKAGGKILSSFRGGFGEEGTWALDCVSLKFEGMVEAHPTYWRTSASFAPELADSDRVCYLAGMNVVGGKGTRVAARRVPPYFPRTDITFSSHFQTPPRSKPDKYPAILEGDQFVYFADPVFRELRQTGNPAVKIALRKAVERLIGPAPFGKDLPAGVLMVPARRGKDLLLTLLHYIPVRKSIEIDVIDEPSSFGGEILHLPAGAEKARQFPNGEELEQVSPGAFALPQAKGRLLIEVPGFFNSSSRSAARSARKKKK